MECRNGVAKIGHTTDVHRQIRVVPLSLFGYYYILGHFRHLYRLQNWALFMHVQKGGPRIGHTDKRSWEIIIYIFSFLFFSVHTSGSIILVWALRHLLRENGFAQNVKPIWPGGRIENKGRASNFIISIYEPTTYF